MKLKKNVIKIILSFALIMLYISSIILANASLIPADSVVTQMKPGNPSYGKSDIVPRLLGIVQFFSVAILLGGIMIAGIGMVINAQDPSKKAQNKGALIYVVVGCTLVFIPTTIVKTILEGASNLAQGIN